MLGKMNKMPEDRVITQQSNLGDWIAFEKGSRYGDPLGRGESEQEALEDLHNQIEAKKPADLSP